jgi:putative spermidine/putrescine transport system permease protein
MISVASNSGSDWRTRRSPGGFILAQLLGPALMVVAGLFGGGLALGMLQSLGYLPAAGMESLSLAHFNHILQDPDFFKSLSITFYIAITSTIIAAAVSMLMALALNALAERCRFVHFIFQVPLTVPHLVVAVAIVFLMSPSGLISRMAINTGLIESSASFPLLVNDRWGIGIMLAYIWKEIPFISLMLLSVLRQTGSGLMEVGRTLNANRWQCFRYITLPILMPSLGAACLIVFAFTFGAFEVPYLLGQTYPLMLPVWAYKNYSDVDLLARPEGIATGIIIAAVVIVAIAGAQLLAKAARKRGIVL